MVDLEMHLAILGDEAYNPTSVDKGFRFSNRQNVRAVQGFEQPINLSIVSRVDEQQVAVPCFIGVVNRNSYYGTAGNGSIFDDVHHLRIEP